MRQTPDGLAGRHLSRRSALRAAAALAAFPALALPGGCGPRRPTGSASPTPAGAGRVRLVLRPWYNFANATTKAGLALLQAGLQPFLDEHPGVDVEISTMGYQETTVAALLAGAGPDVFEDWVLPPYTAQGLILDLSGYIRQDGVDLSIYPSGQLAFFQEAGRLAPAGAGLYCLPAYLHTAVQGVNLGVLDQLGLRYPEPGWTYLEWARLWEAVTVRPGGSRPPRAGAALVWSGYDSSGGNPADFYWWGFGGGFVDPANPRRCYLTAPGSIRFAEWCYGLLRAGVVAPGGSLWRGEVVCAPLGTAGDMITAAQQGQALKWDFYPQPVWPVRKTAYAASDFYAISAAARHPDLCWELVRFLCVDQDWQRYMMRLALAGPNQKGLWEEYAQVVRTVAPPLRGKNLDVLVQAVRGDQPYRGLVFAYADAQAAAVIRHFSELAQRGQLTVREAFAQAAAQVNALQAAGARMQAAAAAKQGAFPTAGPEVAAVPTGI